MKYGILVGFLVLVSMAGAELETIEMGPYEVSFDMGDIEYDISECSVTDEETYGGCEYTAYTLSMIIDDGIIQFWIDNYPQLQSLPFDNVYESMNWSPDTYFRTVDDKQVVMFVGDGLDSAYGNTEFYTVYSLEYDEWYDPDGEFTADYWDDTDAQYIGYNIVGIFSNADWDTTRQLLNTVHVSTETLI